MHEKFVRFANELNHSVSSIRLYFSLYKILLLGVSWLAVIVPCCVVFFDVQASPSFRRKKNAENMETYNHIDARNLLNHGYQVVSSLKHLQRLLKSLLTMKLNYTQIKYVSNRTAICFQIQY